MPRTEAANQRLREAQREKILAAARSVFARKGPGATIADIAAEDALSQGLEVWLSPEMWNTAGTGLPTRTCHGSPKHCSKR